MRKLKIWAALSVVAVVAACAPRVVPPAPEPEPRPQRPQPTPPPPPPAAAWQDLPASAGGWTYAGQGRTSTASFGPAGQPSFVVRCEPSRQVTLARIGGSASNVITVRTSYGARNISAAPQQGALVASLPASDRLLDSMVFSRGRFAIEAQGLPMLIVPAWPELARVVEDCRA